MGPEPRSMWISAIAKSAAAIDDTELLVRPATTELLFSELVSLWKYFGSLKSDNWSTNIPSLYMEYMPIISIGNVYRDLSEFYWSHILNPKLQLMWLGGGKTVKNGRLHYDKFENIMTVIAGKKTFTLFSPTQSFNLYADLPLRPASLDFKMKRNDGCKEFGCVFSPEKTEFVFSRLAENIENISSHLSTYSPVRLSQPDYQKYPLSRNAKGFDCVVETVNN